MLIQWTLLMQIRTRDRDDWRSHGYRRGLHAGVPTCYISAWHTAGPICGFASARQNRRSWTYGVVSGPLTMIDEHRHTWQCVWPRQQHLWTMNVGHSHRSSAAARNVSVNLASIVPTLTHRRWPTNRVAWIYFWRTGKCRDCKPVAHSTRPSGHPNTVYHHAECRQITWPGHCLW